MRVLAALSGGVDSAVAAARAVDDGHEVTAVHLALSTAPATLREGARGCCTLEDGRDARRAADMLGVPFYVWDLAQRFREDVVDDFVDTYAAGQTPNPCLRCNERIKFAAVLDRARALGFDAVCTGHYAQLTQTPDGPVLRRAVDEAKDQSYVLSTLRPDQLAGALFPLGGSHKGQVRAEAAQRGLLVADKPDSHDVCFIADADTGGYLRRALGEQPGDVLDAATGVVLGRHTGAYAFTVGQRRGLDLRVPAADGRPRYVLSISPVERTVTVGPAEALDVDQVRTGPAGWCGPAPTVGAAVTVQLRAHGGVRTARLAATTDDGLVMALDEPVRGVAAGQTLAVYDADRVLGGATVLAAAAADAGAGRGTSDR